MQDGHPEDWAGFGLSHPCCEVVLFTLVSVCLSVNTIIPVSLEISSRNFEGIITWSKWRISLKLAIWAVVI